MKCGQLPVVHIHIYTCPLFLGFLKLRSELQRKEKKFIYQQLKIQHHLFCCGQSQCGLGRAFDLLCVFGFSDFAPHILFPLVRDTAQTTGPVPRSADFGVGGMFA